MKILVIIQRSNGDVYFSNSLIQVLLKSFKNSVVDILVNNDTIPTARLIPNVRSIITFSYSEKKKNKWKQENSIIKKIYRKYDLGINLTSSDRGALYSFLSAKKSLSAIEKEYRKSWWQKLLLTKTFFFDRNAHIIENNFKSAKILGLDFTQEVLSIKPNEDSLQSIRKMLGKRVKKFIIFHPSAQYKYKIYPKKNRLLLLDLMTKLDVCIVITGGCSDTDIEISKTIPIRKNIINLIGKTTIEEYNALSYLSMGYIGMDTLNMHIAASQNKKIFAIYGPTNTDMWAPWSNEKGGCDRQPKKVKEYGNITLFQAGLDCVPCGNMGCDNNFGKSLCLDLIQPSVIYSEIEKFVNGL